MHHSTGLSRPAIRKPAQLPWPMGADHPIRAHRVGEHRPEERVVHVAADVFDRGEVGHAAGLRFRPGLQAGGRVSRLTPGSASRSCVARFPAARRTVNSTVTGCERNAHRHPANREHVLAQKSDRERRLREHRGSHSCAENVLGCLPCPQAAARRRAIRDLDGVDSTRLAQVSCGASPRPRNFVRMRSATRGRQSNAAEISGTFGDKRALRREKSATLTRGRC